MLKQLASFKIRSQQVFNIMEERGLPRPSLFFGNPSEAVPVTEGSEQGLEETDPWKSSELPTDTAQSSGGNSECGSELAAEVCAGINSSCSAGDPERNKCPRFNAGAATDY